VDGVERRMRRGVGGDGEGREWERGDGIKRWIDH
jgi:hypothetical protein